LARRYGGGVISREAAKIVGRINTLGLNNGRGGGQTRLERGPE